MSVGIICDRCRADASDFKIPAKRVDPGSSFLLVMDVQKKSRDGKIVSVDLCQRCFAETLYVLLLNTAPDGVHVDWNEGPAPIVNPQEKKS